MKQHKPALLLTAPSASTTTTVHCGLPACQALKSASILLLYVREYSEYFTPSNLLNSTKCRGHESATVYREEAAARQQETKVDEPGSLCSLTTRYKLCPTETASNEWQT